VSRYHFKLASRRDDAELCRILAATPMNGRVSVSFRREPSFFDAAVVDGDFRQTVTCRDSQLNQIVGFGCRSVRKMSINGVPTPVGYLSTLRVLPQFRSLGLIARGYAYFRELHNDGRAEVYLTTIADRNDRALSVLTSGRAGLPTYNFAGMYHTVALPIARRRPASNVTESTIQVRAATSADLECVLEFLRTVGASRQCFPCYQSDEFFTEQGTFRDFAAADLLLAFRGQRLVGTLGGWDQSGFRRSVVECYNSHLRWSRPAYNTWAKLCGQPTLPKPGESFRCLTAAVPLVYDDDERVFATLLQELLSRAAAVGSHDYLLLGLHESDPLMPVVKRYRSQKYVTKVFVVCWDDGKDQWRRLDGRPLYLELGCL